MKESERGGGEKEGGRGWRVRGEGVRRGEKGWGGVRER